MKSRLRPRIRKHSLNSASSAYSLVEKDTAFTNKSHNRSERQFGQDITSHHNKPHPQSTTSASINKIVVRALNRKRQRRTKAVEEDSPSSSIQNKHLAGTTLPYRQGLRQDIFGRIVVNCQHVNDYLPQICKYLLLKDQQLPLLDNTLVDQHQITERMRMTLVDWIMRIHYKFRLRPQTLFKTINIIDYYTKSGEVIKKKSYQLLGVASLYIACKYQQIYPPSNSSFVEVCAKLYTFENILEMEGSILKHSEFNLGYSTCKTHVERLLMILNMSEVEANIARYLVELSLLNIGFYSFSPLTIATSTILYIKVLLKDQQFRLQELDVDAHKVRECCKVLEEYMRNPPKGTESFIIKQKYKDQIQKLAEFSSL